MKIIIPTHLEHIAPLLDTATSLRVYEWHEDNSITVSEHRLQAPLGDELCNLGVSILLCGGISRRLLFGLARQRIQVMARMSGTADQVAHDFFNKWSNGELGDEMFELSSFYKNIRSNAMKIAVTVQGNEPTCDIDPRFGRAQGFMIFDQENEQWGFVTNTQNLQAAQGAGLQAASTIIKEKCDVLISGNVGPKAFGLLSEYNISVYLAKDCTADEAYRMWSEDKLTKCDNANVEGHW